MPMPRLGRLRHLVEIRRWTEFAAPDADGITASYPLVAEEFAAVETMGGVAYREGVQVGERITHRIIMRHRDDLTTTHVIVHQGRRYRIKRVMDVEAAGRFIAIEVEEEGPHG